MYNVIRVFFNVFKELEDVLEVTFMQRVLYSCSKESDIKILNISTI